MTGSEWMWLAVGLAVAGAAFALGAMVALVGVRMGAKYVFQTKYAGLGLEIEPGKDVPRSAPASYCPELAEDEIPGPEEKPSAASVRFKEQFGGSPLAFVRPGKE